MNAVNRAALCGVCCGTSGAATFLLVFRNDGPLVISAVGLALCLVSAITATALWLTRQRG